MKFSGVSSSIEDGCIPLAQFNDQIVLKRALAGESPSLGKLLHTQALPLRFVDGYISFQHMHAAAATSALPAARKLYPLGAGRAELFPLEQSALSARAAG